MSITRVGIIGSGIMGSGIAETAAVNGFEVVLRSRSKNTADATVSVPSALIFWTTFIPEVTRPKSV